MSKDYSNAGEVQVSLEHYNFKARIVSHFPPPHSLEQGLKTRVCAYVLIEDGSTVISVGD